MPPRESAEIDDEIRRHEARLARDPTPHAFAALAEAHRRAGRAAEALALCRSALERFPDHAGARFVRVKACLDQGDLEAGRVELERLLAREPDHQPALRIAVDLALRRGAAEAAVGYLRRLADLEPSDRAIQSRLRALEAAVGAPSEPDGLSSFLADDLFATITFGDLLLAQGLHDEATAVFMRVLLRAPDHAVARERLEAALGRRAPGRRPRG